MCAYREYTELADRTADAVRPVAAAVPAGVLHDVVFLTYFNAMTRELEPPVRKVVELPNPKLPEHPLRVRFYSTDKNLLAARLRLAAYAVGLPTEASLSGRAEVVAGQARGVIVLWLASRDLAAKQVRSIVEDASDPNADNSDPVVRGAVWPGVCEDEPHVLQWAPKDLAAARALLTVPADRVQQLLATQWARLTATTATTDDLLVAAGLAPLGAPEPIDARRMVC